ncbi:MAG: aminoacyl-tRNA hydrolase [Candidatus Thioglobus sp.]|nr:MAG: aminoacyl-tRNA hydrolase [Candidatus Thioglobus sp.]
MVAIKLIVGLGNPDKEYRSHRHNIGFWFVDALANLYDATFKQESKFFGAVAQADIAGVNLRLLKPSTYMNASGQSIASIAKFYQIAASEVLVVHDELDLAPGIAKIKVGGGHGGHNGLRSIISTLGKEFYRLRIGIGHPGDKSQVSDFVLHSPSKAELALIQNAITAALQVIPPLSAGKIETAMQSLHTQGDENGI